MAPFDVRSLHAPGVEIPISKAAPARLPLLGTLTHWFTSVFCVLYSVFCRLPTGVAAGVADGVAVWALPPEGIVPVKQGPEGRG